MKGSGNVFVILEPVGIQGGFFERRRREKALIASEATVHRSRSGLPFYILAVPDGKKGIDWEMAALKCGRYASRIVAPRGMTIPDIHGAARFIPSRLPSMLTFNTAARLLEKASLPTDLFSLTLCDRNAVLSRNLNKLLPLSSKIRVITNRPEGYARACADAFENSGASILLRSVYEPSPTPDIVICADGCISPLMSKSAVFLFSKRTDSRLCFTLSGTTLLSEHTGILPEGVDSVDFAGALTELCGSGEYAENTASSIEISGFFSDISDPCEGLDGFIRK